MLKDTPQGFGAYTPDNFRSEFQGPVPAWEALVQSRNIPAVTLAKQIEDPDLLELLRTSGVSRITEEDTYGLSIVLGSLELTMEEISRLYCAISGEGIQKELRYFTDLSGKRDYQARETRLFSAETAWIIREMLEENPRPAESGYYAQTGERYPVAYKTGTSIGFRDCWSIGFCGPYMIAVWIGNFDAQGNPAFLGRTMAAPLLFELADQLISQYPPKDYITQVPKGISTIPVCAVSGYLPEEHCPETKETLFIPGVSPITRCKIHRIITIDSRTGYRTEVQSEFTKQIVREVWPTDILKLFEEAGIPRLTPPPYPPEQNMAQTQSEGFKPYIKSPYSAGEYIIRSEHTSHNMIPLIAGGDGSVSTLIWFANDRFIGKTEPEESLFWQPEPGTYELTVMDEKGRSASRVIDVVLRQ